MAYIGREPTNSGEFLLIDDISSQFDGSKVSFTLQVGLLDITPAAANTIIVLDGIVQEPTTAYSISGSTIVFTEAPESNLSFYGVLAGQSQYIANSSVTNEHISAATSISGSKINTDFSAQNIQITHITASGNISASGTVFADNFQSLGGDDTITFDDNLELTGSLKVFGDIDVAEFINHKGDSDTHIRFADNLINLKAGGKSALKYDASSGKIIINNTNENVDFHVMAEDDTELLATDAANNRLGINTTKPTKALTVSGSISGSGDLDIGGDVNASTFTGTFNGALSSSVQIATSISGSLGTNAAVIRTLSATTVSGSRDAASISGSLGANASTIRTLSSTTVSGSFGNQRVGTTDNVKFNNITGSNNISASGNLSITGNVDVDGTSNFAGNVTMQNDLSVTGRINAEEIHTTFISASITTTTGSNVFGDSVTDSHQFTGSVDVSGSLRVSDGNVVISDTLTATNIGAFTAAGAIDFDNQNMTNVDIDSGTITGITDLAVADGGTGASTFTAGHVLLGNGTSAIQTLDLTTDGAIMVGDGSGAPVAETGATLRTSIGVGSSNDVSFANITGSGTARFGDNVAIGLLNASSSIHINQEAPTIRLQDKNNANDTFAQLNANSSAGSLEIEADGNNTKSGTEIIFRVDGDEVFKLDNLGNLGVGQAAKGFAGGLGLIHGAHDHKGGGTGFIHISGSVPRIIMEDGGDTPSYAIEAQDNLKIIQLDESSTGEVTSFLIESGSGNVGIGTTDADAKLDVRGKVVIDPDNNTSQAPANTLFINADGDPTIGFTIRGNGSGANAIIGLDDSDSDKFKISLHATDIGQSVALVLDGNSKISLSNNDNGSSNTIFGNSAAANLDAGSNFNTFIGHSAAGGATMNDGSDNVAVGFESMKALTSGDDNVAVGMRTLLDLDTGVRNTALGDSAGRSVTSGTDNVFVGSTAGNNTTTAAENVFVGAGAGDDTNASQSVFVGAAAGGTANNGAAANTYVGYNAGANDSAHHGGKNVAIGHNTAKSQTTAAKNVVIGASAASSMAIGDHNVIIGFEAALDNTRDGLVIIGSHAGRSLSSGDNNVMIGFNVGPSITSGDHNTIIGDEAGRDLGGGASHTTLVGMNAGLLMNSSGDTNNVCVGSEAGNSITSGTNNTVLGTNSDTSAAGGTNQIVIGYGVAGQGDNYAVIGNGSTTRLYIADDQGGQLFAGTSTINTSDRRIKKDIKDSDLGLNFINKLRPITYRKKEVTEYDDSLKTKMSWYKNDTPPRVLEKEQREKIRVGFIAQEVGEVLKDLGFNKNNELVSIDENTTQQGLAYERFVPTLVKAIQELSSQVTDLKKEIKDLKG